MVDEPKKMKGLKSVEFRDEDGDYVVMTFGQTNREPWEAEARYYRGGCEGKEHRPLQKRRTWSVADLEDRLGQPDLGAEERDALQQARDHLRYLNSVRGRS